MGKMTVNLQGPQTVKIIEAWSPQRCLWTEDGLSAMYRADRARHEAWRGAAPKKIEAR
ncbi:hypothetical protein [Rhizobium giardinii]|uniref:Uncharacterized protein n=1 Tax=Rhizobium giardinii TaxID=56731 RepID=A0A7W8UHI8_9HYPH|nr:hypothetical protein [Rhizobium giardinii]MBB5539455.1 hypothetical protein [Rhizobium giardinii]